MAKVLIEKEIYLGIDLRGALAIKHSLERVLDIKQRRYEYLRGKYPKSDKDMDELDRLQQDIYDEKMLVIDVKESIKKFYDEAAKSRELEIKGYADALPRLIEEAEKANG